MVDVIGNVTDGIDDVVAPEAVGKSHGLLGRIDTTIQILQDIITALRGEPHRCNPQIQVIQHLAQLATPGIGKFRRTNAGSRVDFYSSGTQAGCRVQSLFEWLLQTTQPDPDL